MWRFSVQVQLCRVSMLRPRRYMKSASDCWRTDSAQALASSSVDCAFLRKSSFSRLHRHEIGEKRRRLEVAGYSAEVQQLRRHVRQMERALVDLKLLQTVTHEQPEARSELADRFLFAETELQGLQVCA